MAKLMKKEDFYKLSPFLQNLFDDNIELLPLKKIAWQMK